MAEVCDHRMIDCEPAAIVDLLVDTGAWLEAAAEEAGTYGVAADGRLRVHLGLGPLHVDAKKRVRIEIGEVRRVRERFLVPVTWEASGFSGLFPVMDGLFDIRSAGRYRSRVIFWGRYDPPLGRAGEVIDRYLAHNVALATVTSLLDALAVHLGTKGEHATA